MPPAHATIVQHVRSDRLSVCSSIIHAWGETVKRRPPTTIDADRPYGHDPTTTQRHPKTHTTHTHDPTMTQQPLIRAHTQNNQIPHTQAEEVEETEEEWVARALKAVTPGSAVKAR